MEVTKESAPGKKEGPTAVMSLRGQVREVTTALVRRVATGGLTRQSQWSRGVKLHGRARWVDGEEAERWWTSSRIRWRHTAPLQIIMWCSFHWYFHMHLSFPQATPGMRLEQSPLTSCTRWASSSSGEQLWWPRACTLTQLLPSLPGLSSLGTAPGGATLILCAPGAAGQSFLLIIYSIATERRLHKYGYNVPHPCLWCLTDSNPIFSLVLHKRWLRESI